MKPVQVGLVGAGPWATMIHAPMLAAGPETALAGVWARRSDAAAALAEQHGAPACASLEELFDRCEAVAFAVAPGAQPDLVVRAASAGKAVLMEKPLALTVDDARRMTDAVGAAAVGSLIVLTYRFASPVRTFLTEAAGFDAEGGRAWWFSGAFLGGPFASSPWRRERGAVFDVGPHILDLVEAALGPVARITGRQGPAGWVGLLLDHEGGQVSEVTMSCRAGIPDSRAGVELYGPGGVVEVDMRAGRGPELFATLRREFADVARTGAPHPCDVHRGLVLQQLVAMAGDALA